MILEDTRNGAKAMSARRAKLIGDHGDVQEIMTSLLLNWMYRLRDQTLSKEIIRKSAGVEMTSFESNLYTSRIPPSQYGKSLVQLLQRDEVGVCQGLVATNSTTIFVKMRSCRQRYRLPPPR